MGGAQVVIFVEGGIVHSVATWPRKEDWLPCIVVDFDDGFDIGRDAVDYFEDRLGVTGDEFNKLATYIYCGDKMRLTLVNGYDAVIYNGMAYCGFILREEKA